MTRTLMATKDDDDDDNHNDDDDDNSVQGESCARKTENKIKIALAPLRCCLPSSI